MKEITLKDYLIDGTQLDVARALKITPGAVSQMLTYKRDIWLVVSDKGKIVRGHEIRPLPVVKRAVSNG